MKVRIEDSNGKVLSDVELLVHQLGPIHTVRVIVNDHGYIFELDPPVKERPIKVTVEE